VPAVAANDLGPQIGGGPFVPQIGIRFAVSFGAALVLAGPAGAHSSYQVRWGDTLSGIAAAHGTSLSALAAANGIDPHGILFAGSVLKVPGGGSAGSSGGSYVVRRGDTLSGIAVRYGTSVSALARANGISEVNLILAGSTLSVPAAVAASVSAPGAVAAAWSAEAAIDHWAAHYGVDFRLARALAWLESGYQPHVVSPAGARGVMQVIPSTWSFVETVLLGRSVPRTADGNVRVGVAYLAHLLHSFGGSERLALAAYYQGAHSVRTIGVLPMSARYIADVLALKRRM
jgi:N-acetylmuramoyl-L-alanine amidase